MTCANGPTSPGETSDEDGSLWGYVNINLKESGTEDSDEGSMVMVSRCMPSYLYMLGRCLGADESAPLASSPWPVEFRSIQSPSPPPIRIVWPRTLPWFQAQALYWNSTPGPFDHPLDRCDG